METKIGKILNVEFGIGGYQDAMIGLHFTLGNKGWGVSDSKSYWDYGMIKHTENCKWTEKERGDYMVETIKYLSELLNKAKVKSVHELKNIPIEATFDGNILKSWRILEEAI